MKKLSTLILSLILLSCNQNNLNAYIREDYSISYPDTYTIIEPKSDKEQVLTIQNNKGRIEIFKPSDFNGIRIHGYSSSGLEEYEYKLVPKNKINKGIYEIWVFYHQEDITTKEELNKILETFTIK